MIKAALFISGLTFSAQVYAESAMNSRRCFHVASNFNQTLVQSLNLGSMPNSLCIQEQNISMQITLLLDANPLGQFIIAKETFVTGPNFIDSTLAIYQFRNVWKKTDVFMTEDIRIIARRDAVNLPFEGQVSFGNSRLNGANTFRILEIK